VSDASRRRLAPSPTCPWRQGGSTSVGCGRFNGKSSRAVPALIAKEGYVTAPIPIPDQTLITRRGIFIGPVASLLCAPAIVRAANLMPVRRLPFSVWPQSAGLVERLYLHALEGSLQAGSRAGQTSIELCDRTIPIDSAQQRVAFARAHGFLPPYVCIYRSA
jgi:hypothetical protein